MENFHLINFVSLVDDIGGIEDLPCDIAHCPTLKIGRIGDVQVNVFSLSCKDFDAG